MLRVQHIHRIKVTFLRRKKRHFVNNIYILIFMKRGKNPEINCSFLLIFYLARMNCVIIFNYISTENMQDYRKYIFPYIDLNSIMSL